MGLLGESHCAVCTIGKVTHIVCRNTNSAIGAAALFRGSNTSCKGTR